MGKKFLGVGGAVVESSNPFAAKLLQSKCEYNVGSMFAVVVKVCVCSSMLRGRFIEKFGFEGYETEGSWRYCGCS